MTTLAIESHRSRGPLAELARLARHRDLLFLLVQKDLKVKYRGTVLGFLWSLLNPLLMMLVYAVVFSVLVRFNVERYPVFLLSGILPWNTFTIALTTASMTVVGNANLVRRVSFPREFLPLASVLSSTVNLLLSLGILLVFALAFRQPLGLPLLVVPLLVLLQVMLMAGLGLALAALTVYFRDIENILTLVITILFFVTPIIYPLNAVGHPNLHFLLQLNPLAWLIGGYQAVWHADAWPDWGSIAALSATSVLTLVTGWLLFRRLEPDFAEEV